MWQNNKIDINFKPLCTSHDWLANVQFDRNGNTNPFLATTDIKWNLHFFFRFSFGLSGISIHPGGNLTTKSPLFLIEIRWKQHTHTPQCTQVKWDYKVCSFSFEFVAIPNFYKYQADGFNQTQEDKNLFLVWRCVNFLCELYSLRLNYRIVCTFSTRTHLFNDEFLFILYSHFIIGNNTRKEIKK